MMSPDFLERHEALFDIVDVVSPGFWADLSEKLKRVRAERVTSRGAVVREFPHQEDAATQNPQPGPRDDDANERHQYRKDHPNIFRTPGEPVRPTGRLV